MSEFKAANLPASPPITLSTGRTIWHKREPNGSQHAYIVEDDSITMTDAEWTEYCSIVRNRPKGSK
jgi:hypothetical protein